MVAKINAINYHKPQGKQFLKRFLLLVKKGRGHPWLLPGIVLWCFVSEMSSIS